MIFFSQERTSSYCWTFIVSFSLLLVKLSINCNLLIWDKILFIYLNVMLLFFCFIWFLLIILLLFFFSFLTIVQFLSTAKWSFFLLFVFLLKSKFAACKVCTNNDQKFAADFYWIFFHIYSLFYLFINSSIYFCYRK